MRVKDYAGIFKRQDSSEGHMHCGDIVLGRNDV